PVGNGALALGLARGFDELRAAGLFSRPPALFGVQAASCAPVARAWARLVGAPEPETEAVETSCEGIRIAAPPLEREIAAAIGATGGEIATVGEDATSRAQDALWRRGFAVERTSAVTWAALEAAGQRWARLAAERGGPLVVVLTGSGLKSP